MCIFCGGQCGGVGEFLISLGLPFLVLYFSRMKKALAKIKNKITRKNYGVEEIKDQGIKYKCCGELASTGPNKKGLIGFASPVNEPTTISTEITKFSNWQKLAKKGGPRGIKGWLLLFCLNLTILIPAACLYEVNCTLDLFNSTQNKIFLLMFKELLLYNILLISSMVFLAIFGFYAGMRLWEVKPKAIKTAKIFLIVQLVLTFILVIARPFMTLSLGGIENNLGEIMKRLIPSLGNFSLWYLYLSNSKRVYNTFSEAGKKPAHLRPLPAKLKGYTSAEGVWRSLS